MQNSMVSFVAGMRRPHMERRVPALFTAVVLMGLGVALCNLIGFGTDPCSTMSLGISGRLGISFGTVQLLINAAMFLIVIRYDTSRLGLGTLANMIVVGYAAEFFMMIFGWFPALGSLSTAARLVIFVPTLALFLTAASTYMCVDMGVAPYDAVPQIIAERTKWSFRSVRIAWDVTMMVGGYLLGSTVGLVTVGMALFIGPLVTWMSGYVRSFFD